MREREKRKERKEEEEGEGEEGSKRGQRERWGEEMEIKNILNPLGTFRESSRTLGRRERGREREREGKIGRAHV